MSDPVNQTVPDVPFYANHTDGQRSMLAVYRMVIKALAYKELSWDELDKLSGHREQRKVWTVKSLTEIATSYDISVKMIEPFDYKRLAREGKDYLYELYDNNEAAWYDDHSNAAALGLYMTQFLATVRPINARATLEDIDAMLNEGRLVSVTIDGAVLADGGAQSHAVLVIARQADDYIIHDPGPPSSAGRRIQRQTLWQAMGGEQNTAEVTGFMKRKAGLRLDQYVVRERPTLSRGYATRLIGEGKVTVNGQPNKAGYKLRDQDDIIINYDASDEPDIPDIELPVVYEDDDCIVINKPTGVLTHNKGVRFLEATVASFVRGRSKFDQGERPGIVHRLDRATSGVMICAKTPEALSFLQKQFHDRHAQKTYSAIIKGVLEPTEAVIDMPIERNPKAPATFRVGANGKPAQTYYQTAKQANGYSLLELQPKTGRTHQLRVHLANQKHPIVGDQLYGGEPAERMYLHAHKLTITVPSGQTKTFEAPIPDDFAAKLADA
jgi:23S rRNA pseudouridine1911/1915/1917 synthase